MLRAKPTRKRCENSKTKLSHRGSTRNTYSGPALMIKEMLEIIKINSRDRMDEDTRVHFSKMTEAMVRMTDAIK